MISIGKLINVSDRFYYFVTDDGKELRVHFEGSSALPPFQERIALVVSDQPEYADGSHEVNTDGKYWSPAP